MPPYVKYTREMILKAAVQCVEDDGFPNLSARRISKKFRGSTQPLYSQFKTQQRLEKATLDYIFEILLDYTQKTYTGIKLVDMGVGLVVFSRERPKLYQAFCLDPKNAHMGMMRILDHHLQILRRTDDFAGFTVKNLRDLIIKRWVYIYGLSSLVSLGLFEKPTDINIIRAIRSTSIALLRFAHMARKRIKRKPVPAR